MQLIIKKGAGNMNKISKVWLLKAQSGRLLAFLELDVAIKYAIEMYKKQIEDYLKKLNLPRDAQRIKEAAFAFVHFVEVTYV